MYLVETRSQACGSLALTPPPPPPRQAPLQTDPPQTVSSAGLGQCLSWSRWPPQQRLANTGLGGVCPGRGLGGGRGEPTWAPLPHHDSEARAGPRLPPHLRPRLSQPSKRCHLCFLCPRLPGEVGFREGAPARADSGLTWGRSRFGGLPPRPIRPPRPAFDSAVPPTPTS